MRALLQPYVSADGTDFLAPFNLIWLLHSDVCLFFEKIMLIKPPMLQIFQGSVSEEECSDESSSSAGNEEEDGEFTANEEDGEITLTT